MVTEKTLISFDYAIKYLLKDKGDHEVIESFISAVLKTRGYKPVKIIALLESESNRESDIRKISTADVIVEDEDKNKYIIEIERHRKDTFIHKSLFNTSRLIVDNLESGKNYNNIIKVFHISLLYFIPENVDGIFYHGKTIINEIETNEKLSIDMRIKGGDKIYKAENILPEYFFIFIPAFSGRIKNEIDDWLYVMKNSKMPSIFYSKYMEKVARKLSILKMTESERIEYNAFVKSRRDHDDSHFFARAEGKEEGLKEGIEKGMKKGMEKGMEKGMKEGMAKGIEKGMKEGMEKGMEKGKMEMAKNMLMIGMDINDISKCTGLSIYDIENCKMQYFKKGYKK